MVNFSKNLQDILMVDVQNAEIVVKVQLLNLLKKQYKYMVIIMIIQKLNMKMQKLKLL
jgi:hypothetical protein